MQLQQKQLDVHLKNTLSPLYLISGDIPLLAEESRESIVTAARSRGFSEKETCHVDSGFQLSTLEITLSNLNLFDEKKIVDIRNPAAKFDAAWIALLTEYLAQPSFDRVIILSTGKLTSTQQKSPWFELIKNKGVYLPLWPIALAALPEWINDRAKKMSLKLSSDAVTLLSQYSEGNILAATQALEKLQLLFSNASQTNISREQVITVLSDFARFTIFDLTDALALRDTKKVMRILKNLAQTGEEPPLVLWSICRKIREQMAVTKNNESLKSALQYAACVDAIIKGAKTGDVWQALSQLCFLAMGQTIIPSN